LTPAAILAKLEIALNDRAVCQVKSATRVQHQIDNEVKFIEPDTARLADYDAP